MLQALGCLLYFLLFGKLAFQAEAKLQILNGDFNIPPTRPPPLSALLRELLVVNPAARPDIDQVLARLQQVSQSLGVDPAMLAPGLGVSANSTVGHGTLITGGQAQVDEVCQALSRLCCTGIKAVQDVPASVPVSVPQATQPPAAMPSLPTTPRPVRASSFTRPTPAPSSKPRALSHLRLDADSIVCSIWSAYSQHGAEVTVRQLLTRVTC